MPLFLLIFGKIVAPVSRFRLPPLAHYLPVRLGGLALLPPRLLLLHERDQLRHVPHLRLQSAPEHQQAAGGILIME